MKWLLILQLMTFSPDGELLKQTVFKQLHDTYELCSIDMDIRFEEWRRVYETSSGVGIIGKCTEVSEWPSPSP